MRQLLKQRITVNRPVKTQGSNMGTVTTLTAVYTDVAASVQPASSAVMLFYAQRQLKVTQTIYVAQPMDLVRGDRITHGALTYSVIGWRDLAGRGRVLAIDCEDYL